MPGGFASAVGGVGRRRRAGSGRVRVTPVVAGGGSLGAGLHVSRVQITNYRNFANLELDPFPPHAVVVGENGVGKSNLLSAMRLVLDPTLSEVARVLRAEDVWDGHPTGLAGGAEVTVTVDLTGFEHDEAAKAVLSDCLVSVDPYVARLNYRFAPVSSGLNQEGALLTVDDYEARLFARDDETVDVRRARRYVSMRVLPALRDAEGDLRTWRTNPLKALMDELAIDQTALTAVAQSLQDAVDGLTSDTEVKDLENRIASRIEAMAGARLDVDPTLGFASSDENQIVRSVRLFVDAARRRGVGTGSRSGGRVTAARRPDSSGTGPPACCVSTRWSASSTSRTSRAAGSRSPSGSVSPSPGWRPSRTTRGRGPPPHVSARGSRPRGLLLRHHADARPRARNPDRCAADPHVRSVGLPGVRCAGEAAHGTGRR